MLWYVLFVMVELVAPLPLVNLVVPFLHSPHQQKKKDTKRESNPLTRKYWTPNLHKLCCSNTTTTTKDPKKEDRRSSSSS